MKTVQSKSPQLRFSERLTNVFLGVMVTIYPLWLVGDYQTILQSKYHAFLFISGIYILLLLFGGIKRLLSRQVKFPNPKILWNAGSPAQKMVILFWAFCIISSLCSSYGSQTLLGLGRFEGLISLSLYCVCFLCISTYAVPNKYLVYFFGTSMTVLCIIATVQLTGRNPFSLYPCGLNYFDANVAYTGAYLSTIGNTDMLASLLCIAIPTFGLTILRQKGNIRFLLAIPLLLCLYVLIKENVSAGYVGIAFGTLLMLPVVVKVNGRTRKLLWQGLLGVIIAGVICVYFFGGHFGGSIYELSEILHGRIKDTFGSSRIYIWKETLKLVPLHLWFGGGPDTLIARINVCFERYDSSTGTTIRAAIDSAHNEYLNILVNEGLFALLAYLGALICSFITWIKQAPKSNTVAITGGAVLCYCIQAVFGISCCITAPALWISMALLDNSVRKGHTINTN